MAKSAKQKKKKPTGGFESLKQRAAGVYRFYTSGLRPGDFKKLFTEETKGLYTHFGNFGDEKPASPQAGKEDNFYGGMKTAGRVFMGFLYALSPARRIIYGITFLIFILSAIILITAPDGSDIRSDAATFTMYTFIVASFLLALELADKLRAKDELELARELQVSLLPGEDNTLPGLAIERYAVTATEVGGDYHDLAFTHGRSCVAIGDVSGHGLASGVVMAMAKSAWMTQLENTPNPSEVLRSVDSVVRQVGTRRTLMTFLHCQFNIDDDELVVANAGHIYPLIRSAKDGSTEWLETPPAYPLGVGSNGKVEVVQHPISPGDVVVLVSDGLIESVNEEGHPFDYDRIADVVGGASGDPKQIAETLVSTFSSFIGSRAHDDDITLLVIGYKLA